MLLATIMLVLTVLYMIFGEKSIKIVGALLFGTLGVLATTWATLILMTWQNWFTYSFAAFLILGPAFLFWFVVIRKES